MLHGLFLWYRNETVIRFAYLQAEAGSVESGWRRLSLQELGQQRGAPSMALRLDQDHGQLPLDVL
jgi:hypothetical protein